MTSTPTLEPTAAEPPPPGEVARLCALGVYPVKSARGSAPGSAVVEPWGLAGDRRWLLVDAGHRAVTQREQPRMALVGARPLADGGIELSAPGRPALTVTAPGPAGGGPVWIFGTPVEAVPAAREAGAWFADFLGLPGDGTRLVHLADPARARPLEAATALPGETVNLADSHPLLLTTTASLAALNAAVAAGDHPEEGPLPMDRFRPNVVVEGTEPWAEDGWRRIRIGEVAFRVAKPCARCVISTTDQATGVRGREPLRTLAAHRRFGTGLIFGQKLVPEARGTLHVGDSLRVVE